MMYSRDFDGLTVHAPVGTFDLATLEKGPDAAEPRGEYREDVRWLRRQHRKLAGPTPDAALRTTGR